MTDNLVLTPVAQRQQQWQELQKSGLKWRVLLLSLLGVVCAASLTWFMHYLIESTHHELDKNPRMRLLDFVRLKREETSQAKEVKPQRPNIDEAPEAPDVPQNNNNDFDSGQGVDVSMSAGMLNDGFQLNAGGYGVAMNDGDYLPIVKIAPVYPPKAQRLGMEGNCVVRYTVTGQGTVRDVQVVEEMCDHPVFHKVSIDAALKFRYKPRVIDGEAVEVPNVMNRFIFEMDR